MKNAAELWQEIKAAEVRPGTLSLWWLYQTGLVLKTPGGTTVVVDPYLSDAVLRTYQLPRNVPTPLDPDEVEADALLATHSHADHLDPDSITPFMSHEGTQFVGLPMAVEMVLEAGVKAERATGVARGDVLKFGDLTRTRRARASPVRPRTDARRGWVCVRIRRRQHLPQWRHRVRQ